MTSPCANLLAKRQRTLLSLRLYTTTPAQLWGVCRNPFRQLLLPWLFSMCASAWWVTVNSALAMEQTSVSLCSYYLSYLPQSVTLVDLHCSLELHLHPPWDTSLNKLDCNGYKSHLHHRVPCTRAKVPNFHPSAVVLPFTFIQSKPQFLLLPTLPSFKSWCILLTSPSAAPGAHICRIEDTFEVRVVWLNCSVYDLASMRYPSRSHTPHWYLCSLCVIHVLHECI